VGEGEFDLLQEGVVVEVLQKRGGSEKRRRSRDVDIKRTQTQQRVKDLEYKDAAVEIKRLDFYNTHIHKYTHTATNCFSFSRVPAQG
jgi:hypothetical protein